MKNASFDKTSLSSQSPKRTHELRRVVGDAPGEEGWERNGVISSTRRPPLLLLLLLLAALLVEGAAGEPNRLGMPPASLRFWTCRRGVADIVALLLFWSILHTSFVSERHFTKKKYVKGFIIFRVSQKFIIADRIRIFQSCHAFGQLLALLLFAILSQA